MYKELLDKKKKIAVVGLGYVGLPIALEFARHFKVVGFDINENRLALMRQNIDPSSELESSDFEGCDILFTNDIEELRKAHFFVVAVPTDIDAHKVPNLRRRALISAAALDRTRYFGSVALALATRWAGSTS